MYEVVEVLDGMAGGHYAVRGPVGNIIGKEFRLDYKGANILKSALYDAFKIGKDSNNTISR